MISGSGSRCAVCRVGVKVAAGIDWMMSRLHTEPSGRGEGERKANCAKPPAKTNLGRKSQSSRASQRGTEIYRQGRDEDEDAVWGRVESSSLAKQVRGSPCRAPSGEIAKLGRVGVAKASKPGASLFAAVREQYQTLDRRIRGPRQGADSDSATGLPAKQPPCLTLLHTCAR